LTPGRGRLNFGGAPDPPGAGGDLRLKITLVPSSGFGGDDPHRQNLVTYLIGDSVAIDAGCLALHGGPADQERVRHVLITHTHADHVATLPIFLENCYRPGLPGPTIYGSRAVLDGLMLDLFNGRIWPDLVALSPAGAPFLNLVRLEPGRPVDVDGLRITPVAVDHTVPTMGFIVDDGVVAVAFSSDTGPTDEIWRMASALPHLRAVFLDSSFPDELAEFAAMTCHLTPRLFAEEIRKVLREVRTIAIHLKPKYRDRIIAQLEALELPRFEIGRFGVPYEFT